jgi:hypothetical protein
MAGIQVGVTCSLIDGTCAAGETINKEFILNEGTESVLMSLFAEEVNDTLDVTVYTLTEAGKEVEVISFPQLVAPTTDLLLRRAATGMQRFRVEATCGAGGTATFEVRAKGLTAGELSVNIQGADDWNVLNATVTTTRGVLIAASLTDRNGLLIRNANFTGTEILRVAESEAKLISGVWASVLPGESIQPDLQAGNEVWAESSSGSIRVEIVEVT